MSSFTDSIMLKINVDLKKKKLVLHFGKFV